ncbi:response regulator [Chitinibacter bivalviorum]|uniref:histidine kinase n=1 Tax=Chitinibacter bivalviorum TaxID=2739434 RepID=A0A7H9BGD7_9NEIS|nr:response regulator [Chitinibacter bivalviorum]QLG87780.1 response regulator [Chitinibacter bivalviorum]
MPFQTFPSPALTVLVVDDIATTRLMLAGLVRNMGYQVQMAADGEQALAMFSAQQPDMVLLDLLMPGIDGFAVTRQIKAMSGVKWVPVVVLSGLDGEQHLLAALDAGADDFLHKPAQPSILASKLKNLARVIELQQQHAALLNKSLAISENSFDAIVVTTDEGEIHGVNCAAERLILADRDVLLGRAVREILPNIQLQLAPTDLQQGQLQQVAIMPLRGEPIPVEVGLTFFYEGGQRFWLLILHDIRERERVDRLKQQFIATLSHELRTPLTSIIGSLKMLQSPQFAGVDQRAMSLLEMADRNAGRLLHMVNELLDLNKAAAGALQLELHHYKLHELLEEVLQSNQGYAAQHEVQLRLDAQFETARTLCTDKMRFLQIMGNLISNACKYSPRQSEVVISVRVNTFGVQLAVRDQGCGVAAHFVPSLFEPFTQADASDSRLRGGTGLGLAITRQLCQAFAGSIEYQPAPGGGSEFTVSLPWEVPR